jgi:hypothetical protein
MTMRVVFLIVFGAVLAGSWAVHEGRVQSPAEVVEKLANRPEVGNRFADPEQGRFDATVFLFTCIILAPIAGLGLVLVSAIGMMLLEGTVFQLTRRVGLPDKLTAVAVTAAAVGLAWSHADLWLPRSIRLLGTIARAWVVSTT